MAQDLDPYKLSSPQVYLWRMVIFLIIVGFLALILYRQIYSAFLTNVGLNSTILLAAIIGIVLSLRQVIRLFPEVRWVNDTRLGDPGMEVRRPPVLLAPMATLVGDSLGERFITTHALRSILESIGSRLDEMREISRYLTGLLVFLGLLGTFWGLLQTINSVGETIQSLDVGSGDSSVIFEDLKTGLERPLSGMGTAFASSLFGLAGSLVLGFLDLQAGQAQNRFYTDLEDWLTTFTDIAPEEMEGRVDPGPSDDLRAAIDRLSRVVQEGGSNRSASQAMANLAEGIQGLVQHVRSEQKLMRDWAEAQSRQQSKVETLLEQLNRVLTQRNG